MVSKLLYRYEREPGKWTTSLEKPNCTYNRRYRLIADDGKVLTLDGQDFFYVIDVDDKDGWYEIDDVGVGDS